MDISLDMPEKLRVTNSIVHLIVLGFVELRNVEFPKNDLASVGDQFQNIISEREQPSTTSEGLVIIQNTHQVQTSVAQPIIEDPQPIIDNPTDQVVHEVPEWLNN